MSALVWHWPQLTWAGVVSFNLLAAIVLDGEPKKGRHSFSIDLFATILGSFILWQGGFWGGASP